MKEVKYVIKDEIGIHARPAGLLVKAAGKFNCTIRMKKDTTEIDAKSIFSIMTLGVKKGDEIAITFEGSDEAEASDTITAFLVENL